MLFNVLRSSFLLCFTNDYDLMLRITLREIVIMVILTSKNHNYESNVHLTEKLVELQCF